MPMVPSGRTLFTPFSKPEESGRYDLAVIDRIAQSPQWPAIREGGHP